MASIPWQRNPCAASVYGPIASMQLHLHADRLAGDFESALQAVLNMK